MPKIPQYDNLKIIIQQLNQGLCSGEMLGEKLQMSRAGVWKIIKQAQTLGIPIEGTPDGYHLAQPITLLDAQHIQQHLPESTRQLIQHIDCLDTVPSTSSHLLTQGYTDAVCVAIAEMQSAGIGRRGRAWEAPFGSSILLSLSWPLHEGPFPQQGLNIALAVAARTAICRAGYPNTIQFKWPNDLYIQHQKLAGILVESRGVQNDQSFCVVSIGLNCTLPPAFSQQDTLTDLYQQNQVNCNRNQLAAYLIDEFVDCLRNAQRMDLDAYYRQWAQHDMLCNQAITYQRNQQTHHGVAKGISSNGGLIVQPEKGPEITIYAGDVHAVRTN